MNVAAVRMDYRRGLGPRAWIEPVFMRSGALKQGGERGASQNAEMLNMLMHRIAAHQDRQAFRALFENVAPRLKTFLMRTGSPAEVAEEIIQETMLSVWRKASYFDPSRAAATTWIFTIARNAGIDGQRRDRKRETLPSMMDDTPDAIVTPEEHVMAASRDERVRHALSTLSEEQATIVRLSFFSEKPHSEIARELGLPLGTVKSRARLALAKLRQLLAETP